MTAAKKFSDFTITIDGSPVEFGDVVIGVDPGEKESAIEMVLAETERRGVTSLSSPQPPARDTFDWKYVGPSINLLKSPSPVSYSIPRDEYVYKYDEFNKMGGFSPTTLLECRDWAWLDEPYLLAYSKDWFARHPEDFRERPDGLVECAVCHRTDCELVGPLNRERGLL